MKASSKKSKTPRLKSKKFRMKTRIMNDTSMNKKMSSWISKIASSI